MKHVYLALALAVLAPSVTVADNKKSFWPSWLTFKKQSTYFDLPALSKSIFDKSNKEKAGICAGVGLTATFLTAALFFIQTKLPTTRR